MAEDTYERYMLAELTVRKHAVVNQINNIEGIIKGLRARIDSDSYLNELGELQASGPMLDTAVAAYAVQRQNLKNYIEMRDKK